jgi:hypothetical protein
VLLSGFLSVDYAQLIHRDPYDAGPTVVARLTNTAPNAPHAYHLVQPTLRCDDKQGLVCIQKQGSLTVFLGSTILHTSTLNEHGPDPKCPSLGIGCVQKTKVLNGSERRSVVLEDKVSFPILEKYNDQ